MDVGTAAVASNTLLGVVSKVANYPRLDTSVADLQGGKYNPINANAELIGGLNANKLNALFSVNGNMIALKKDVIVEPLLIISESAFDSNEYDKIGNLMLDMFTNNYADTFNTLQNVYGLDSQTIITVLGTDNGYSKLKGMFFDKAMKASVGHLAKVIHESGLSTSYDDLMALKMDIEVDETFSSETSVPATGITFNINGKPTSKVGKMTTSNPVEYIKASKNDILGQTMLERRIIITLKPQSNVAGHPLSIAAIDPRTGTPMSIPNPDMASRKAMDASIKAGQNQLTGNEQLVIDGFRIPITIKARVLKVTPENIAQVAEPHKKFNTLSTWLDVKAGLSSLSDYFLQRDAVNRYKKNLFKGNDFLKIINERKLSAYSKVATTAVVGFELNYSLLIITQKDKQLLDRYLNINIFKEDDKEDFMASTFALSCAVLDDDSRMATFLTPKIRGINSVTYNELKKFSGQKDYDIGDLLMAITKSRTLG